MHMIFLLRNISSADAALTTIVSIGITRWGSPWRLQFRLELIYLEIFSLCYPDKVYDFSTIPYGPFAMPHNHLSSAGNYKVPLIEIIDTGRRKTDRGKLFNLQNINDIGTPSLEKVQNKNFRFEICRSFSFSGHFYFHPWFVWEITFHNVNTKLNYHYLYRFPCRLRAADAA